MGLIWMQMDISPAKTVINIFSKDKRSYEHNKKHQPEEALPYLHV